MAFSRETAFDYLQRAHENGRLAHAYLVHGPSGSGKKALTESLCDLVKGTGEQASQGLGRADVTVVEPESKSRRIKIEQMRKLEHGLQMKTSGGGRKVAVVFECDRLGVQAANAFLKTLEEPPENSLLLLVTAQPEALMDTIISRCISVPLHRQGAPELTASEQDLLEKLAGFFSLPQRGLTESLILLHQFQAILDRVKGGIQKENSDEMKSEQKRYKQTTEGKWLSGRETHFKALGESLYIVERTRLIEVLIQWWADVLRQKQQKPRLDYPDYAAQTAALAESVSVSEALAKINRLEELRDHLDRNIQETLALETAFLRVFGAR